MTKAGFFLQEMTVIKVIIITVAKAVIHKARLKGIQLNLESFLNTVKIESEKEYYSCVARDA